MSTLFLLLFGHALADYPLQADFLARGKNRTAPIPGFDWWILLWMHALIHGGVVAILTGSWLLGVSEACLHFVIDDAKCRGMISFRQDQALHLLCKFLWWVTL